jgi:hypothetical protein
LLGSSCVLGDKSDDYHESDPAPYPVELDLTFSFDDDGSFNAVFGGGNYEVFVDVGVDVGLQIMLKIRIFSAPKNLED